MANLILRKAVEKKVLEKIKPNKTESQKVKAAVNSFLKKLNSNLSGAKAILGGSGEKDTWLSGIHDIDIFVQYDYQQYKDKSAELSELLYAALKRAFPKVKLNRLHGSRDYFQLVYQKYNFELVPIIKIKKVEEALNITDISLLHAIWVNHQAKKLKDEIRLAKQFCKANQLYGAESYISGFSGYVLEILITKYGSFEGFLKAAISMGINEVIDIKEYYKGKDVFFQINKSKLQSPIVVIDPVDKDRNAAAALSLEKFISLKKVAREYLEHPDQKYFEREEISFKRLREKENKYNLVYLTIGPLAGKEDVVGAKLVKAFEFLKTELSKFEIKQSGWDWDKKAVFYFFLAKKLLPEEEIRPGPPLKLKEFVKDFKKKNKNTFESEGKVMARIKVEFPGLESYVKNCLEEEYFKEKIKAVKEIKFG